MVPCFSSQPAAGSTTSAQRSEWEREEISCTTTNRARPSAASARRTSGMLTAGLVHMIQIAFSVPASRAPNISVAVRPGLAGTCSTPHSAATSRRWSGLARSRCAGSMVARPPTSRPPIALGWPVSENGPEPGLPICPVSSDRLSRARFLSTPAAL